MRRPTLALLAALLPAAAARGATPTAEELRDLFPAAPGEAVRVERGQPDRLALPGQPPAALLAVRFTPDPTRAVTRNADWCGLLLRPETGPPQALVTVGTEWTELLACDRLLAFGQVPAPRGTLRVAFLYATHSSNAAGRTPVVLSRPQAGGPWTLDETISRRLEDLPGTGTIPGIRRALGGR